MVRLNMATMVKCSVIFVNENENEKGSAIRSKERKLEQKRSRRTRSE